MGTIMANDSILVYTSSGIIKSRYLTTFPSPRPAAPDGCSWVDYHWEPETGVDTNVNQFRWTGSAVVVEARLTALERHVQAQLDSVAKAWGYDDIRTAVSYVGDDNPAYAAEAALLKSWRSVMWTTLYASPIVTTFEAFVQTLPPAPSKP